MSTADTVTWESRSAGYSVQYQLPVFREIEFLVNDGFRRIPHGGIETGGLLFGAVDEAVVRVESFQPIECEHAYGPSFQLSEGDIEQLQRQIVNAPSDGSIPVGWFIAHTRSELVLNERESALFSQLFPQPGRITVLVKPERFKATRFAFLVRDRNGAVEADGGPIAFVLPQGERQGVATSRRERPVEAIEAVEAAPEVEQAFPETPPVGRLRPAPVEIRPEPPPRDPEPTVREATVRDTTAPDMTAPDMTARDEPALEPRRMRSEALVISNGGGGLPAGSLLTWSLFGASLVFAVLAIYGFYLRFAPGVVPITVMPSGDSFLVSWPAAETRDAAAAEVRVNNKPARPLSNEEKASGKFSTHAGGGDLMVDLVVHHRFRTARGITRYLVMPAASGQ